MPQDRINLEGRIKGNGQISGADLVNGPAAPTETSETTPAVTLNGSELQCVVNGYVNYGYEGRRIRISAVTDPTAAGVSCDGGLSVGISVIGVSGPDPHTLAQDSEQMTPEPRLQAAVKNRRTRKKSRRRRHKKVPCVDKCELLPQQQPEEENWENEIQDVKVTDWETMYFGVGPYGKKNACPEDVLQLGLRGLTFKQTDMADLPVYSPAAHHPYPVQWLCHNVPTEPDQFADAEE